MLFRVQYVVRDLAHGEHLAHQLAHLHARGTHQHRAAGVAQGVDLLDHRIVFLPLGLEDHVLVVLAHHRTVGGDHHHVQLVDVPQFLRFRLGRTGHTGQLVVHAEVVLQGHRRIGLRGRFHLHLLLALDGLVQSIAVAAPFEDTAGLLVHDLHLAVHHHVLHVVLVEGVSADQLVHRVDALALDREIAQQFILAFGLLLGARAALLDVGDAAAHVGHDEEGGVVHITADQVNPFLGELDAMLLLVDGEVQLGIHLRHVLALVLQVEVLRLLQVRAHAVLAEELDQGTVLRQCAVGTQQGHAAFLQLVLARRSTVGQPFQVLLRFGQQLGHQLALCVVEALHTGLVLVELVHLALRCGAADDERCTRIVHEHAVHLIHDGEVVLALHEGRGGMRHVVAQVVEAEFVVGAVGDIGHVGVAAIGAVGLVLVDAVHPHAVELVQGSHPFCIALGQVIVHGNHVYTATGQGVEEDGQGAHQGLALTGAHLGDLPRVQGHTTDQLHIVVEHVPGHGVASGRPGVLPDGCIPFDADGIRALDGELAVHVGGAHAQFAVLLEATRRFLHHGEGFGQYLQQHGLDVLQTGLLQLVDVLVAPFALVDVHLRVGVDLGAQGVHLVVVRFRALLDACFQVGGAGAELVVAQTVQLGVGGLGLLHQRHHLLEVALGFITEYFLEGLGKGTDHGSLAERRWSGGSCLGFRLRTDARWRKRRQR